MTEADRPAATAREVATAIAARLADAGFEAYFAGGCVRDRLLGLEPTDYDIATSAHPQAISELFRSARSVGESFGVVLVRLHGHVIEVATFRTDGDYMDGRRPESVRFCGSEEDAQRRDFTINGLFEDPRDGRIIDYVDGERDLHGRTIRAIGDPAARFGEDHLRMLRAVRFAARFGFEIDAATARAIETFGPRLDQISRERIGMEMRAMFTHATRGAAAALLEDLQLDGPMLGEAHALSDRRRVSRLPAASGFATALGAWLLDRHGGGEEGAASVVDRWVGAMVLSNAERAALLGTLATLRDLETAWDGLPVAGQKRLAVRPGFEGAVEIMATTATGAAAAIRQRVAQLAETVLAPPPLLTGDDLIEMGFRPGPAFRGILEQVYDAQLEGELMDRPAARELGRSLAESEGLARA